MNGRQAKRIRREVYGDQATNAASRKYFWQKAKKGNKRVVITEKTRRVYRFAKKLFTRRPNKQVTMLFTDK